MKTSFMAILFICTAGLTFAWLSFSEPAVEAYTPVLEEQHPEIDSILTLAYEEYNSSQVQKSKQLAFTALELSQSVNYNKGEVLALMYLGINYTIDAKVDSSKIFLEEARRLVKTYGLDKELYYRVGVNLSEVYQFKDPSNSFEYLNEAIEFYRATEDYLRLADAYLRLGTSYYLIASYTEAEETFLSGLEISQYVEDTVKRKLLQGNFTQMIGNIYRVRGDFEKAVPMLETSVQIGRKTNNPGLQASGLHVLGHIQFSRGHFRKALNHYHEQVPLYELTGWPESIVYSYVNIARVYDLLNDFVRADEYLHKATVYAEDRLDDGYAIWTGFYYGLAHHKILREDLSAAQTLLEKVLKEGMKYNRPSTIADCYVLKAWIEFLRDNFLASLGHARTAAEIFNEIAVSDAKLARAYQWMGLAYHEMGVRDSALVYYTKSEEVTRRTEDPNFSWQIHYRLARLYKDENNTELAMYQLEQSIASIERMRYFTISPELAGSFLTDKTGVYRYYFDVLFDHSRTLRSDAELDKLLSLSEQTRGRVIRDILGGGTQNIFSQIRESAELQVTEERIVAVNRFIRDEMAKQADERRNELIEEWQEQLTILQREYDLGRTQFAAAHPELSAILAHQPITVSEIQEHLPLSTALISYYMSDEYLYSFTISNGNADIIKLTVVNEQLREAVERLRIPFEDVKEGRIDLSRMQFDVDLTRELYTELIEPLAEYIDGKDRLIIVPDGPLYYLLFELLIAEDTGRYLLEDFVISYLPTSALIPLLHERRKRETDLIRSLMAFGDPVARPAESEDKLVALSTEPRLRNILMTPLPAASREVEDIAAFFGRGDVLVLTGDMATESAFKRYAPEYRYIHFATHGYVNEINPNYSALLLNPGDEDEDGLLHAYEIFPLNLNAELVSMSACETGLGRYMEGEGLVSLVQAFFAAGSRNVMASLWSVEDSTYPIMVEFYRNINNGMNIADALRKAKLTFIVEGPALSTHPFMWAPFVLYGLP